MPDSITNLACQTYVGTFSPQNSEQGSRHKVWSEREKKVVKNNKELKHVTRMSLQNKDPEINSKLKPASPFQMASGI